jgi:transcription-repair coupling factor (superfamily II helicase)
MDAYKEIAEIGSLQEEKEFKDTITETYGALPQEAENLINIAVVKMLASKLGVSKITITKSEVSLVFSDFNHLKIKLAIFIYTPLLLC